VAVVVTHVVMCSDMGVAMWTVVNIGGAAKRSVTASGVKKEERG